MEDKRPTVRYFQIDWLSRHDGPGPRVVIFFQGCNSACPWCHSPHSRFQHSPVLHFASRCLACGRCGEACPEKLHQPGPKGQGADADRCRRCGACVSACPVSRPQVAGGALLLPTREAAVEDLFEQVRPQLEIVRQGGGLTLSGGEALLQLEGASRLLKLARDAGLQTAVESSGAVPREHFEAVAGLVDCWLFGLRSDHPATAAAKGFGVKADNLRFIASLPTRVIVRKPLVAGITDCKEELEATADLMSECGLSEIDLLPLNPHTAHYYQALGLPCPPQGLLVPSGSQVSAAADFFSRRGFKVTVGQKTPSATGANQQKQIGPSVSAPPFREQTQTGGI